MYIDICYLQTVIIDGLMTEVIEEMCKIGEGQKPQKRVSL